MTLVGCGGACDTCEGCADCLGGPVCCECCGGSVVECSCEWEERYAVDRIEGGEAIGPGYYVEVCATHSDRGTRGKRSK